MSLLPTLPSSVYCSIADQCDAAKAQGINAVDDCTERSTTPRKARLDFLSLPRELRDMIYAHLVLHDHPLILNKPPLEIEKRKYYGRDLEPAVAQTCRQVRDEVVDIFYHRNHFILVAPPDAEWMRALVDEVGERPIASLQRLTVCFVNLKERTNIVPWVQYIEDKLTHLVEVRYDDYNDLGIWFGELVRVYRSLHNDEGLSWAELHRVAAAHAALFPAVLMSDWPVWKDDEAIFPRITYENGYGTIEAYEGNECRRCVLAEQSLQRQRE